MNNYAVIGLGNISTRHRKNLKKLYPSSNVLAMSASGRKSDEPIEFADEVVASLDEIIQCKPKMVIVASPATFHAQHSIPLIEAGIPVLIEKPISANTEDSLTILNSANRFKTPVSIGYCLRYLSSTQYLRPALKENIIGELYNVFIEIGQFLPLWRPSKNYRESVSASAKLGGGALLELSHELDYAQWLFGKITPLHTILRSSNELSLAVEDTVDILALGNKETVVSIHLDFLQKKAHRKCRILGSKGTIEWDLIKNQITLVTEGSESLIFDDIDCDRNQIYLDMILDFESLINGQPNQCVSINEAHETVSLIEAIKYQAATKST